MDVYTNYSLKSWDELTFTDDYMFKLVMSKHPKFIKKLLEIILQVKVRDIYNVPQSVDTLRRRDFQKVNCR